MCGAPLEPGIRGCLICGEKKRQAARGASMKSRWVTALCFGGATFVVIEALFILFGWWYGVKYAGNWYSGPDGALATAGLGLFVASPCARIVGVYAVHRKEWNNKRAR
jgi:hypothetical protein